MDTPKPNRLVEGLAVIALIAALVLPGWYVMSQMGEQTPGARTDPIVIGIGAGVIFLCVMAGLALYAVRKREPRGNLRAAAVALVTSAVFTGAFVFTNLALNSRQRLTDAHAAVGTSPATSPHFIWALLLIGGPAVLLLGLGVSAWRNRSRSRADTDTGTSHTRERRTFDPQ